MKILLLKITFFLSFFILISFTKSESNDEPSKILGVWEYTAQKKGSYFQKGTVVFSAEGDYLKGLVSIGDKMIPMRKLIFKDDKVRAYIFVNGIQVDLYLKFLIDYSFDGIVSNPSGYMKVTGCKKEY
jgi:hypothetical protein